MITKNYLRSLRALKNKNQSDMAKLLKVSLQTYNKKENGKVPFTAEEIKVMSDYFQIPIENFFNYKVS